MRWLTKLPLRFRSLFRRQAVERELDAELRFHLEQQIAENIANGMAPDEARRAALRSLGSDWGGLAQVQEECRDARSICLLETGWHDIRFAARMLAKSPGFTLVAIFTLAIGIGFNTAAFSAAQALLFGGLPVKEPDRLVLGEALREGFDAAGTSLLEYDALWQQHKAFSSTALSLDESLLLRGNTEAEQVHAAAVTAGFFETLGTSPTLGRALSDQECGSGGALTIVLAYDLWQRRFGGSTSAIGQSMELDGRNYTIVGVMPRGFDYPTRTEAWVPMQIDPATAPMPSRISHANIFVARLQPGISVSQAEAATRELMRQLEREYPQTERGWSYGIFPLRRWTIGDDDGRMTVAILVLVIAIAFVLLICCANVANLLLVRGVVREGELAIRVALGASRWRIARQLMTEGLVLSALGGCGGLLFAYSTRAALRSLMPVVPHSFGAATTKFNIDAHVLAFCVAASLFSGLFFSVLPAVKLAYLRSPIATLRTREHRSGGQSGNRRWLGALVTFEIAIAAALSFAGVLLTKSFYGLQKLDLGFRPEHLLTLQLPLSPSEYPGLAQRVAFVDRVLDRVRLLPGIDAAGTTTNLPLQDFSRDSAYAVEDHPQNNPASVPMAAVRYVSSGYMETLGLRLIKGRMITPQDRAETLPVAVISEELARQGFGNDDPIGKRIRRGRPQDTSNPWLVVVGVVKDAKEDRLNFRIARPVWYIPYAQNTPLSASSGLNLVARTHSDPAAVAGAVRAAIREVNQFQPVVNVSTEDAMVSSVVAGDRFSARVMAILAGVGLFLAALGLYTVIAYSVTQRTGEIGLRMALGARPGSVLALVARQGCALAILGLAIGTPLMLLAARLLAGVLFAVRPNDPSVLFAITAVLSAITIAACALPAWRATRLDPLKALRHD